MKAPFDSTAGMPFTSTEAIAASATVPVIATDGPRMNDPLTGVTMATAGADRSTVTVTDAVALLPAASVATTAMVASPSSATPAS